MINLEFYVVEESSGIKTKIENNYDLGSIFKGGTEYRALAIRNTGDEPAIKPRLMIGEYFQEGKDYSECVTWKKLSFDKNADEELWSPVIELPDIPAGGWMPGKEIYSETFPLDRYPEVATPLGTGWTSTSGDPLAWETYSGFLRHTADNLPGTARWDALPSSYKDFIFSTKITVRNGEYAGYILRDIGDGNTGYIVLVQGDQQYFPTLPAGEGVIQVWAGRFSDGPLGWTLLYQTPNTIGIRGTHDFFKVKLTTFSDAGITKTRFDFWYQNQHSEQPLYSWIDEANTYTQAARPILCTHPNVGSKQTWFDDLYMEVDTAEGRIWLRDKVGASTKLFGKQYSLVKMEYGGE